MFPEVRSLTQVAKLFPNTVEGIKKIATTAQTEALQCIRSIVGTNSTTWDSVISQQDRSLASFAVTQNILGVIKETSPNAEIRESARSYYLELENFGIEQFQCNRKLYQKFNECAKSCVAEYSTNACRSYYVQETASVYRRLGLELPEEQFEKVLEVQRKISQLRTDFQKQIAEDTRKIVVSVDELRGVPLDTIQTLKMDSENRDSYLVGTDYPTYFSIMRNCQVESTRQSLAEAFDSRAFPANEKILAELIHCRHVLAQLVGYESYASLDLEDKMVGSPTAAQDFLQELIPPLRKKWSKEYEILKDNLPGGVTLSSEGRIKSWDLMYVIHQYKTKHLQVDENLLKEYFPLSVTVDGLFHVLSSFLDLHLEKVHDVEFWDPQVFALRVTSRASGNLVGHIVLDLFPREGKYSHACCCGIVPSVNDGESFTPAVAVVLANFPVAVGDTPALFTHNDVVTFFHEMGHAFHMLLGRSEMCTMAGYNVKTDFVEMPSQILEYWMWESSILREISSHYRTKEPLPDALIQAKIDARNFFAGRDTLRQIIFATLSLRLYNAQFAAQDVSMMQPEKEMKKLTEELLPGIETLPNSHFTCSFGHLEGYGAAYYGYLYAEVFAADVFHSLHERKGLLSPVEGKNYVKAIIGVGGSSHPSIMLRRYLGRDPNSAAFWKKIGVTQPKNE